MMPAQFYEFETVKIAIEKKNINKFRGKRLTSYVFPPT